jgi:hypothetical protein
MKFGSEEGWILFQTLELSLDIKTTTTYPPPTQENLIIIFRSKSFDLTSYGSYLPLKLTSSTELMQYSNI